MGAEAAAIEMRKRKDGGGDGYRDGLAGAVPGQLVQRGGGGSEAVGIRSAHTHPTHITLPLH